MISSKNRADLKSRLHGRERVFAGWTSIGHPQITEAMARSGVDFMGIDIEHSTISLEQSQRIIAASQAAGVACLPRLASHNPEDAKRLFDSGADGIIVPMVSNAAEAAEIASWCKYPPDGKRSFGVARAQGYGLDFADYTKSWNASSILIVQIESAEGVANIDAIAATPGIDGIMVGPYDLSGSLGVPGVLALQAHRAQGIGGTAMRANKTHRKTFQDLVVAAGRGMAPAVRRMDRSTSTGSTAMATASPARGAAARAGR